MRSLLFIALLLAAPAFAQEDTLLVVGGQQRVAPSQAAHREAIEQFPAWAVTNVGANTSGMNADIPAAPEAPSAPAAVGGAAAPASPQAPAAPAVPSSPLTRAWPHDTVPIFMRSCIGYQPKLAGPCFCVVSKLVNAMPHDEFMRLTAAGTIEQDVRLANIRSQCATAPRRTE